MTTEYRYQSPPNWPAPPEGWAPPDGWTPPSDWTPPPDGWQFWVPIEPAARQVPDVATTSPSSHVPSLVPPSARDPEKVPLFGARRRARELAESAEALAAENARLRAELERTGAMGAVRIAEERAAAQQAFADEQESLERQRSEARDRFRGEIQTLTATRDGLSAQVADLQNQVVHLEEEAILQEVGVYEYQHPLQDVEAYKQRLADLRSRTKEMAKSDGGAIRAATGWTVNGSAAQGRKMVSQRCSHQRDRRVPR